MAKHYVGEIGTLIVLTADSSISTASGVKLFIQKPDATIHEWTATVASGLYITHTVSNGEFDQAGKYSAQPWIALSGGWSGYGETSEFEVYKRFC